MSNYGTIRYDLDADGVATLTIDRPDALNALNEQVLDELHDALTDFARDAAARVLVLTGAGPKSFVAGADIKQMVAMGPDEALAFARKGGSVCRLLADTPKPTLAAVNGFALGGGCELALSCDMIFASEKARFGQPEVRLGVIPGFGGTQRLARVVGPARALYLVLSGDSITAPEALSMGLVVRLYAPDALLPEVTAIARTMATKCGPLSLAAAKEVTYDGLQGPLARGLDLEARRFASMFTTSEQKEGMAAFIEKRPARFPEP